MPYSSTAFKEEIKRHILANIPAHTKMLDVGPGAGTYGLLLGPYFSMDGLEIHEPYVDKFKLNSVYNKIIIGNILAFDFTGYDYIIMGDILEHIPKYEAMNLVDRINCCI